MKRFCLSLPGIGGGRRSLLVAALAPLLLVISCDYGRMWETPAVRPHEAPIMTVTAGSVPVDGGEALLKITPDDELTPNVAMDDPAVIASGAALYATYCVHCHGPDHDGLGTVGQSFAPQPLDLRSRRVQRERSVGSLFKEVSYGAEGGRQPPLATTVAVTERWRIIAYVKSLGAR